MDVHMHAISLILFATGCLMFWLPFAILRNLKRGGDGSYQLAKPLEQVRHGEMLKALCVNVDQYLHKTRIANVHRQLKACNDCENLKRCARTACQAER